MSIYSADWDRGSVLVEGEDGILRRRVPTAQVIEEGLWDALFPYFGPRSREDEIAAEQISRAMRAIRMHIAYALEAGARAAEEEL